MESIGVGENDGVLGDVGDEDGCHMVGDVEGSNDIGASDGTEDGMNSDVLMHF
jgi:hypothetical protein